SRWRNFDYEAMAGEVARQNGGRPEVLVCDRSLPEGDPAVLPGAPELPSRPEDAPVRWIFYTSGTTADPKGAQHTDATIGAAARWPDRLGLGPEDRHSLVFPFTHMGGIVWLFSGLMYGCTNIVDEVFNPDTTIPLLKREGVTLAGAGTFFHLAYLKAQRD